MATKGNGRRPDSIILGIVARSTNRYLIRSHDDFFDNFAGVVVFPEDHGPQT
jgi:hypothetical protein